LLRTRILSTGSYLPEKVLSNYDLEKMVDTSDEWITERTGIKERRIAAKDESTSDLCYHAAKKAIKSAGIKAREIDLIVVATVTGDMLMPATACFLQKRLGARNAASFDINAACSGFIYALSVADKFIRTGDSKRALVVGAETFSKFMDWEDRSTCVLFGDGAGAVVLGPTDEDRGIISIELYSDGGMNDLITIPGGGSKEPPSKETLENKRHCVQMKGNETFKVAVKTLEKLVVDTLKKNNVKSSELSLLIPHQANLRIIQATAKRLKLPMERVFLNLDKYGNTSAASIPIALDEAVSTRRVRDGDYILLEAFGGGLTWGAALVKW
jgi:3-oxoacyl-[acyl-carrier-protein] synthase-3